MVDISNLYEKVKIPFDENLLNQIIQKYLDIPLKSVAREEVDVGKLLYNQINIINENANHPINQETFNRLIEEISKDFDQAGKPFNPADYNGVTSPLGIQAGWMTFQSWHLLGTREFNIEHRFYFGISNDELAELTTYFYHKYKNANIPFYFKIDNNSFMERRDNLVVYTSTELLEKNLRILSDLEKERPDLLASCSAPSILVGKLDEKIGYATEDVNVTTSYTDLIVQEFIKALNSSIKEYLPHCRNRQVMDAYQKRKDEAKLLGINTDLENAKYKILLEVLIQYEPSFKQQLFDNMKNRLLQKNIDLNNICFNKIIKEKLEMQYNRKLVEQLMQSNSEKRDLQSERNDIEQIITEDNRKIGR